jgi:flagellar protein FliL
MINPEAEGFDEQLDAATAAGAAGPKRGKGRMVMLLVLLAALGGGGWFAWQTFMGEASGRTARWPAKKRPGSRSNANYLPLDPPLVVNFAAGGQLRYLQVSVEVMARDVQSPSANIGRHAPGRPQCPDRPVQRA